MKFYPLKDWEDNYEISKKGIIRSVNRIVKHKNNKQVFCKSQIIKSHSNKKVEYQQIKLYKNNKPYTYYIHILVAKQFIVNPKNLPEVNHKDGNKQNNHKRNLEWVTRLGNVQHAINTGLRVYTSKMTDLEIAACLYNILEDESFTSLCQRTPYALTTLTIRVRKIAKQLNLEFQLDDELKRQKTERVIKSNKERQF